MKIVFVDQYLPFESIWRDYKRNNIQCPNPIVYYKKLNSYFDLLEKQYNTAVIIAVHPKSDYEKTGIFSNRWRIRGLTKELIEQADLILSHCSKSLEWVNGGKVNLLTYDEIEKSGFRKDFMDNQNKLHGFDFPFVNIDRAINE